MRAVLNQASMAYLFVTGKPIVSGTRISVSQVLRCLSHGMDLESIREMYGEFPAEAIPEVLRFASAIIEKEKFDVAS